MNTIKYYSVKIYKWYQKIKTKYLKFKNFLEQFKRFRESSMIYQKGILNCKNKIR